MKIIYVYQDEVYSTLEYENIRLAIDESDDAGDYMFEVYENGEWVKTSPSAATDGQHDNGYISWRYLTSLKVIY